MKAKTLFMVATLMAMAQGAWAQTNVSTDQELRAAIQINNVDIKLLADLNLSNSTLNIAEGMTVTIDLDGHALDRKLTKRGEGGGQVITVRKGATLNLKNGTLKGGWGGDSGGINNEGGTANLTDVTITGCTGDDRGGGIVNRHGSTLTMTRGAITGNISNDKTTPEGGGGLFNAEGATATLTGVTITGNTAKVKGGGGICNYGTLTMDGCTVTGNSCQLNGGGIWNKGTLNMQGVMTVTGNTTANSVTNNLFLKTGAIINVTNALTGSNVGIIMETPGVFTSGYSTYHSGTEPATIFTSDCEAFRIVSQNGEGHFVVDYIVCSWDSKNRQVVNTTKTLTRLIGYGDVPTEGDYKLVTNSNNDVDWFQLGGYNGDNDEYYVVSGNVSNNTLNVLGKKVHLILLDGAKLTLSGGILCYNTESNSPTLYIHSQSYGSSMGKLDVKSGYKDEAAGIGSDWDGKKTAGTRTAGNLEIHGGKLTVQGGGAAAGIGGGHYQHAGTITIFGGDIKATGGEGTWEYGGGAGIGGGFKGGGGHLIIYDGKVYAQGVDKSPGIGAGRMVLCDFSAMNVPIWDWSQYHYSDHTKIYTEVEIYGGQVEAHGAEDAAGIGGGNLSSGVILKVFGGDVKAYGGNDGAGIGGGYDGDGGYTIVKEGTVYAKGGGNGAGIGSGTEHSYETIFGGYLVVDGGHIEAYGGVDAAGIGGGEDADGGVIIISGGYVYAKGSYGGAGIGGGEEGDGGNVTITGGTVHASAGSGDTGNRAIGPGYGDDVYGSLTIADEMMVYSERMAAAVERHDMCWYRTDVHVEPCTHQDHTYTLSGTTKNDTHTEVCQYCTTAFEPEQHTFEGGICTVCGVELGIGTGIGMMSDGRGKMSDAWYDLQGRKLNFKPTQKGVYIKNGKIRVIK